MPPGPVQYKLPSTSTFIPSGSPGAFALGFSVRFSVTMATSFHCIIPIATSCCLHPLRTNSKIELCISPLNLPSGTTRSVN
jgi:hypothetical protein